jgi:SAM-dependent methyltransferase
MWLPTFVCPECEGPIDTGGTSESSLVCAPCGRQYERKDGVWRFLIDARRARLENFARQYRTVRTKEGRRSSSADYYRTLPAVAPGDPHAREWQVRGETYRHLLQHVLATGRQPSAILDLGAGSGWLSHRLALLGHRVVAVDAIEDECDGLGAVRHYATPIVAIHADFDALPLARGQFDVVVFNGSLHYASDPGASLARAHRVLAPGGTLVVMDSPMFRADEDGAAMVAEALRRFAEQYGIAAASPAGCGYLTFRSLDASAGALRLQSRFVPSRGPFAWRLGRNIARLRLGREPAAFGLWVAR